MEPNALTNEFKEFLKLLNDHEVEYLIVGGHAVAYHGYPRSTGDLDVWVSVNAHNAKKLAEVMIDFGFPPDSVSVSVFMERDRVLRMGVAPNRIEILTGIDGVEFDSCYKARVSVGLDGIPVSMIGLDNLKENKRASGRHKDLADLDELP
jgi:predicted nucleotidyltransferase